MERVKMIQTKQTQQIKTKWTEEKVLSVIQECRQEGLKHAQMKLSELQDRGPQYVVTNDDTGKPIDTLLDLCGFAHLRISAKSKFYRTAKKLAETREYRFSCGKAYYGGGRLNIFDSTFRQEISVNIAACEGQSEILAQYGIESTIDSRVD